jgi:putative NIF3 family GTP cyclohydrolase 1 type 2
MKAQEIVDFVFSIAPDPDHAWENVFLFGNGDIQVTGVGVGWWLTVDIVEQMAARGLNLGFSHERTVFEMPERFVWGLLPETDALPANRRMREVTDRHAIAIHQVHSNVDKAEWGMPVALLRQLGWGEYPVDWSRGVPVVDLPPRTLRELVAELKEKLALPFVRYDGEPDRVVKRAALSWGGLCQGYGGAACAQPLGFDVLIGGDIVDGIVRMARAQGWAVIDAWHHATEMDAMRVLSEKVRARFPDLPIEYFPATNPWSLG